MANVQEAAGGVALLVRVPQVHADIEAGWSSWYDRNHIAHRMRIPGFLSARRYVLDKGRHRVLAAYEMTNVAALSSPAYHRLREWEAHRPAKAFETIAPRLPGFERGVYESLGKRPQTLAVMESPALLVIGHHPDDTASEAFEVWQETVFLPALLADSRVAGARLLRQLTSHQTPPNSGTRTPGPRYFTVAYIGPGPHDAARVAVGLGAAATWPGGASTVVMCGRRVHSAFAESA